MAQGHRVALIGTLLKVERLELCNLSCARGLAQVCPCDAFKALNLVLEGLISFLSVLSSCGWRAIGSFCRFFLFKLNLVVQLPNQSLLKLEKALFVGLQGVPERGEGGQGLRHEVLAGGVRNLHKEGDGHQVKCTFLVRVTVALHHHQ